MGCGGSKVNDLPLVIRCRERKEMIKSAMDHRYDLSSSHLAYFHSLKDIGYALSRFIDEEIVIPSSYASSPVLTLPSDEGKSSSKSAASSGSISHLHSIDGNEDSHLHLSSDSESDLGSSSNGHIHIHDDNDDDTVSVNNSKPPLSSFYPPYNQDQTNWDDPFVMNGGPPPNQPHWGTNQTNPDVPYRMNSAWGSYGGNFDSYNGYGGNSNMYYMKKSAPASRTVVHQEVRGFQETTQWPDPSDYNSYDNGGFFGFQMGGMSNPQEQPKQPSPSKDPPPPPSPKVSGWDFFNFFDGYDNGYQSYGYGYGSTVSSPDSNELRQREGIPDLEEETESESHNEELNRGKKMDTKRNTGAGPPRFVQKENTDASSSRTPPGNSEGTSSSIPSANSDEAHSVHIKVDTSVPEVVSESMGKKNEGKKGVSFDVEEGSIPEVESSILSSLTTLSANGSRDLREVFNEIKDEFEVAFGYGKEVAVMLEAGKVPYQPRFLKVVLSRILYLVAPSLSSSQHAKQSEISCSQMTKLARSYHLDAVTDVTSINLSSTLEKLYAWEKKLYKEVKDEERLRLVYNNMCKRLKDLDARGAESGKIDTARASVRRLMTKLDVCIKAIDGISSKIQKLRDEELQPQVSELIYGLIRMWKLIVKCHQKQFQAIMESKTWTVKANTNFQRNTTSNATLELEARLLTWCKHFKDWINAQKSYINSLNAWLHQCINQEPELTIDGIIPFSPGRIGAPQIFIICNDLQNGLKHVSEERVSTAMHVFAGNLRRLLERQHDEQQQRLKTENIAKDYSEKRRNIVRMKEDNVSETMDGSIIASESGRFSVSVSNDVKVELSLLRKKADEERRRHKEAMKLVDDAASSSIQGGMVPLFKALENFTCDALKAHEQVRLQNP